MKYFSENGLLDLVRLIKGEFDKKVSKSVLEEGEDGQFVLSDGNGGVRFLTIIDAEEEKF